MQQKIKQIPCAETFTIASWNQFKGLIFLTVIILVVLAYSQVTEHHYFYYA